MIHVAILKPEYIEPILTGAKRIESRITHTARAPFDRIDVGERIYFKASAGPFRATALVDHVICVRDLTPHRIRKLRSDYNHAIGGRDEYWKSKRNAKFATLIWLKRVQPITYGPRVSKQRGIAWVPLPDSECVYPACLGPKPTAPITQPVQPSPASEPGTGIVFITGGNLRNGHVYFRGIRTLFPTDAFGGTTKEAAGTPVTLELNDGLTIETDLVDARGIFRARQWRRWFEQIGVQPGDGLQFRRLGGRRYAVTHIPKGRT
ncbi:MAG: hypothetical protein HND57_08530 [Planctomycetes bacterium]|nr:hypothetical protein [Planctomycetota bacterium]